MTSRRPACTSAKVSASSFSRSCASSRGSADASLRQAEASFPVQYPGANVPQAWAAGSVLRFIAILAGIHATTDATGSRLYVNPALPDWLPSLTIRNLRAGGGSLDLALNDGDVEVLSNTTRFEVIHGPAPRPEPARLPG